MAHEHIVYMMLVESACFAEDTDVIKKYARQLESLAERDHHLPYLAIAKRARGVALRLAGKLESSAKMLEEALQIFTERGMYWQIGRTMYEKGLVAKAQDAQEQAMDCFTLALERYEKIGARPFYGKAKAALDAIVDVI